MPIDKEFLEILACPVCKGELKLRVDAEDNQEILTGALYCPKCNLTYPINDAIPNLLPPEGR